MGSGRERDLMLRLVAGGGVSIRRGGEKGMVRWVPCKPAITTACGVSILRHNI